MPENNVILGHERAKMPASQKFVSFHLAFSFILSPPTTSGQHVLVLGVCDPHQSDSLCVANHRTFSSCKSLAFEVLRF